MMIINCDGLGRRTPFTRARRFLGACLVLSAGLAHATCVPESDIFHPGTTLQPVWRLLDPAGDATLTLTGTHADLSVPAGSTHDLWSGAANKAPRLLQATPNSDFGIEVKFDSIPAAGYQLQGLIVQEDDDTFLRFDTHHTGSGLRLFVAYINGASATTVHNAAPIVGVIPRYLRVERTGDNWAYRYSQDGVTWITAVSFTRVINVTESGFFAGNYTPNPAFTASVAYFNNLACPLVDDGAVPPPTGPAIDIWYGDTQDFGMLGNPQIWVNISGRVSGPNPIAALTYSLNGDTPVLLSVGPNGTRLLGLGDFVTEIGHSDLNAGPNSVVFNVADSLGNTTSATVTVNYTPGQVWPLPYTADWSASSNILDVGQIVDGLWTPVTNGVRTVESGYDRLINLGDETWETNYEVVMPFTIHSALNDAGVGFAVGWQGHTGSASPRVNWPLQSISWIRYPLNNPRLRVITYPSVVLSDQAFPGFQANTPYLLKSRSVSIGGGQSRVFVKLWEAAAPEPALWMIEQDVTSRDGSVLLICHKADVTVGNVTITPVAANLIPQFDTAPVTAATVFDPYTYAVTVSGGTPPITISASTLPTWLTLTDHGDGTATLSGTPGPADIGPHSVVLLAEDADGETDMQSFTIGVSAVSPGCVPVSDDFAGDTAPKPFWRFVDPLGDGTLLVGGDTASVSVPAGVEHDFWSSGIDVPRLLQSAPAGDFQVEVKFDSIPAAPYQLQGLIVQETDDHALRFETYHNGSQLVLFVADINAATASAEIKHNAATPMAPQYLQVQRAGNDWTYRVSEDATNWTTVVTFTLPFTATEVGFYAGNAGPNPAFTAVADYFKNEACPDFVVPCHDLSAFTLDWSQYPELNPTPGQIYPHITTLPGVGGSPVTVTVTVPRPARDAHQVNTPGITDFPGTVDVYTPTAETYRYWRPDDDQIDTLVYSFSESIRMDTFMFGGQRPPNPALRAYAEITFWDGPDGTGNKVLSALPNPAGVATINTGDPLTAAINILQDRGAQQTFLSTDGTYAMASSDPAYPPRPWAVLQLGGAEVRSITWSMYVSPLDVSSAGTGSLDLDEARAQKVQTGAVSGYIAGFDFELCMDGRATADLSLTKSAAPLPVGESSWDIPISKGEQHVDGDYWLRLEYDEPSFDVWGPGNLKSGVHLDADWHHVVGRFTEGTNTWGPHTMEILVDGIVVATRVANGTPHPSAASLFLGSYLGQINFFNGYMDEVRLSRMARSDAWLQATHANLTDPSSFLTVGPEGAGSLPGYAYQRTLTIPSGQVSEPLTGFPVLVSITDAFLINHVATSNGADVVFTDALGTALPYEIESYHQPAGKLTAWVQLPLVDSGSPTSFLMQYDNAAPGAPAFPAHAVWDDDFVMVQHLNETSGSVLDSSAFGNDGAVNGATPTIYGVANGGYYFDGVSNDIEVADAPSLHLNTDDFTIEAWLARRPSAADGRFTITVENHGPDAAHDIVVSEDLAPAFTLVRSETTQGLYAMPPGLWTVGDLQPGETATLWIDFTKNFDQVLTNSVHILHSSAQDPQPDNNAAETVVDGDTYTPVAPSWMKPDFIITEVLLDTTPGTVGESFTAHVTVKNQGDIAGSAGWLRLFVSQASPAVAGMPGDAEQAVGTLNVNETATFTFAGLTAPALLGTHHVRAFVDADDGTDEKSEGNNQQSMTYTLHATGTPPSGPGLPSWMKPDFIITDIVMTPVPNVTGARFDAYITVFNQGDIPGDGGVLRVWYSQAANATAGMPGDAELPVGSLAVNESRTLIFTGLTTPPNVGWHHFRGYVDADDTTDEKSGGNNQKSQVYRAYDTKLVVTPVVGGVELTWNSQWGLTYKVMRSSSLLGGFTAIATGVPATPPTNTYIDSPPAGPTWFYFIDVE